MDLSEIDEDLLEEHCPSATTSNDSLFKLDVNGRAQLSLCLVVF